MRCPSAIQDEEGRLIALGEHGLRAGVAVPSLTPIVEIAARLFGTPAAAVNIIGNDHVFFAASSGIGDCDMSRDVSFCGHAITQDDVMVVPDAALDPRFHDNPLVTAGMVRFYAGVPLRAPSGHALGALCVVDGEPRATFDEQDRARLKDLASMASEKLELRRLEVGQQARPSGFAAIAATSPYSVICFDEDRRITAWNPAAVAMFGYAVDEAMAQDILMLLPQQQHGFVQAALTRVLGGGAPPIGSAFLLTGLRRDGSHFSGELTWSHWHEDGVRHFGAIVQDVTDRLRHEDALYRLANYDSLTGLPNRNLLYASGAPALATHEAAAVIMIDLDGFKDVNDTLGQGVGDAVLRETGRRLSAAAPEDAMVARTGGDEFVVLLPGVGDPLQISALAARLVATVACPVLCDGHEVRPACSCGYAMAPQHGERIDDLLSSANLALSHAKSRGGGGAFLFLPMLRAEAAARRLHDGELHHAVERGELRLHYQPQIRLTDGALVGAEALLRWQHPRRNLLQPAAFLPALESGALAAPVGSWVLDTACAQAAQWRWSHPDFRIAVNLFSAQFRAGDLAAIVAATLERHGLPAEALELEITENIALDDVRLVLPQLRALHAMGIALAFDDFGTGYGSLNLLKNYPVQRIKIDKGFIQTMQESAPDRAIVLSLIGLAHQLQLNVIAEGVETEAQRALLDAHKCGEAQGYLFGEPMAAERFADRFGLNGASFRARA